MTDGREKNVRVILLHRKEVVAFGQILSTEPSQMCFFREVGQNKCMVSISKVFKMDCPLPYPQSGITQLGDIYDNLFDLMSNRLLWDNNDMVMIDNIAVSACHIYNTNDIVDCTDFDGNIVCSASFKSYCSFDANQLFATVKLISVTDEGTIQNAMADDGVPFYSPDKSMMWCVSKLSFHATNTRHVSFNETMNEYYTYHDRNYNNSSNTQCATILNDGGRTSTKTTYNSDFLTDVEDVNCNNSTQFKRIRYNSDVLTGVDDINARDVTDNNAARLSPYNSDVLTGVDDVLVYDLTRPAYNSDILTGIDDVVNNDVSGQNGSKANGVTRRHRRLSQMTRQSQNTTRASSIAASVSNASRQRESDFSAFDFDVDDDIGTWNEMSQESVTRVGRSHEQSPLQEDDPLFGSFGASQNCKRKRVLAFVTPKKSDFVLSSEHIKGTLMQPCCKKLCIRKITYKECEDLRLSVWRKRGSDRHNYLLQMFGCFLKTQDNSNLACNMWEEPKLRLKPVVSGKTICSKAFQGLLGVSHGMFWQIILEARSNIVYKFHGNTGTVKQRTHSRRGLAIMRGILEKHALPQPHLQHKSKDGVVHCEHHLPLGMRKGDVFKSINKELQETSMSTISTITLYRMWRHEFRHVKTPTKQRMSKCKICDELKTVIETSTDVKVRDRHITMRNRHLFHVFDSRKLYTYWKEESRSHPEQSLCLIIDGMDQSTTTLPHFKKTPPRLEGNRFLKTHVCGVLVHGFKLLCDVWIDALHLHDSNQVATSIMRAIRKVQLERGNLPPILRIQADNCWRENKNRFIFGLCSMLVAHNIFQTVEMGFLMVGHTHEDIDQVFSVISRELKFKSVLTMPDMLRRIGQKIGGGRTESSEVELLERMVDWKRFIEPFIVRGNDGLEGHTNPHYFRFQMFNGEPTMQWKYHCTDGDDAWSEPFRLLHSLPSKEEAIFLAPTNELDNDEMKGLTSFREYGQYMCEKYPEYKDQNLSSVVETTKLLEYLTKQKNLSLSPYNQQTFWPQSFATTFQPSNANTEVEMDVELLPRRYCGRKGDAPLSEFIPNREVAMDKFVAVRPPDEDVATGAQFWMAKVVGLETDADGMVTSLKALWYEPKSTRRRGNNPIDNKELYENCLSKDWIPNNDGVQDVDIDAVIYAWKTKTKRMVKKHGYDVEKSISIPEISQAHIKEYLYKLVDACAADVDEY